MPSRPSHAGDIRGAPAGNAPRPAYDIVVVGGGMAGVMAALAAKSAGNRVLIIEPSNVLGGQGTAGGVAGFCGDSARVNDEFAAIVEQLLTHGLIEPYRPNEDRRPYDLEWCAFFLQERVVQRGIDVLLHARVVGVRAKAGVVHELTVASSGGLLHLAPKFVVDASGACVVAVLAGFPYAHEGANRQLPMSLYFTLWDTGRPVNPVLPPGCPRWNHDGEIPMTSLHRFPSGKVEVKMKVVGFDAADGFSRSQAEIFARRQMHGLIFYLQTVGHRGRKLDTHVLASVSRGIGVREERRIIGEHLLTEAEARQAVIFPDAIAVNTYHIDFHWPDRMQRAGTGITDMLDPHHLPLRMMIPKGAKNVLVPGRGASGEQMAMSAFRVMAVVAQMGYAAGHAARQCVERDVAIDQVDVPRLQVAIEAGGQSLDLSDYGEYLRCDHLSHDEVTAAGPAFKELQEPVLAQVSNARFLAAWLGTTSEPGQTRGLWIAERRERMWLPPRRIASDIHPSEARLLLARDPDGALHLWCLPSGEAWSSRDQGATWVHEPLAAQLHDAASGQDRATLDDGTIARAWCEPDANGVRALHVSLSRDGGRTFSAPHPLNPAIAEPSAPAMVATRVGLAIVFVGDGARLHFWHGSVERITAEPVVPSSVRLNAPPVDVTLSEDPKA